MKQEIEHPKKGIVESQQCTHTRKCEVLTYPLGTGKYVENTLILARLVLNEPKSWKNYVQ